MLFLGDFSNRFYLTLLHYQAEKDRETLNPAQRIQRFRLIYL